MAALRQVHAHNSIAQIQQSKINCQIGLCTGVGLNIGIFCAEQLAGTLDGNVLHLVHIDTAAIVALAGQALGVLVGQDAAHCGHDWRSVQCSGADGSALDPWLRPTPDQRY